MGLFFVAQKYFSIHRNVFSRLNEDTSPKKMRRLNEISQFQSSFCTVHFTLLKELKLRYFPKRIFSPAVKCAGKNVENLKTC